MTTFGRAPHHRGFSLISAVVLMVDQCLSSSLLVLPRNQGTSVSSVNPSTSAQSEKSAETRIIPGWKNSSAIIFFVAIVSLALTIPMFVYIWIRRRRLHAARTRLRNQEAKARAYGGNSGARKGSTTSTVNMPLTAAAPIAGRERRATGTRMEAGTVNFAEPVQISVKPIKAVEIIVKPLKSVRTADFKDPMWEKNVI